MSELLPKMAKYGGDIKISQRTGEITNETSRIKEIHYIGIFIDLGDGKSHRNMLLVNPESKSIELFEPHGEAEWSKFVTDSVSKIYKEWQHLLCQDVARKQ